MRASQSAAVLVFIALSFCLPIFAVEDISRDLERFVVEKNLPALAVGVIKHGEIHSLGVAGMRVLDGSVPAGIDDPFHLGSCTKNITATLIGMLVAEGKLRWDQTLAELFPDMASQMSAEFRSVTIDHLLAHRSGFADPGDILALLWSLPESVESQREQRRRAFEEWIKIPLANKPGAVYQYSNAGYIILGLIVETVLDDEWETIVRERIYEPLEMNAAGFGAMGTPDTVDAPWQHAAQSRVGRETFIPINPGPKSDNPPALGPAGRAHCSIGDWAKYVQALLKLMRDEPSGLANADYQHVKQPLYGGNYAMGLLQFERGWGGGHVYSHNGSNTMNYALMWIAPEIDFAVLVAFNRGGGDIFSIGDEIAGYWIERGLQASSVDDPHE